MRDIIDTILTTVVYIGSMYLLSVVLFQLTASGQEVIDHTQRDQQMQNTWQLQRIENEIQRQRTLRAYEEQMQQLNELRERDRQYQRGGYKWRRYDTRPLPEEYNKDFEWE